MKLILLGLAFVALAAGQQYLPPNEELVAVENEYLPPPEEEIITPKINNEYLAPVEAEQVASEPNNQYLAPIETVEASEPIEQIAEDGYRYKTVKRIRYRTRRDVSELASAQYIPPLVEDSYGPPPSGPVEVVAPVEESAVLADDGYRYKTVRRIRYRHRRDVNELAPEYLPPNQEDDSYSYPPPAPIVQAAPVAPIEVAAPAPIEVSAPVAVQETAALADDGYRYKTIRRIRYRHRRDVNELASAQYLPPTQTDDSYSYPAPAPVVVSAPIVQAAPIEVAAPAPVEISAPIEVSAPISFQESAALADDGYRYKTVKRIRYRHRRDVSELAPEYLPPNQEDDSYSYPAPAPVAVPAPVVQAASIAPIEVAAPAPIEISAPVAVQETAALADDGYRYKTVKRIRYRHRRDVNELASAEYLPPNQADDSYSYPAPALAPIVQAAPVAPIEVVNPAPVEILAPVEISAPVQQTAELADDGYRYKTVRRIRYRHRRDVNELAPDYLPPTQEDDSYSYPAPAPVAVPAPIVQAAPIEVAAPAPIEISAPVSVQETAALADDGYRYKTVRRIRYRHRRDVNELAPEYLPPSQEDDSYSYPAPAPVAVPAPIVQAAPIEVAAPAPIAISAPAPIQQTAELADDGYRYKTVKKYKIKRH